MDERRQEDPRILDHSIAINRLEIEGQQRGEDLKQLSTDFKAFEKYQHGRNHELFDHLAEIKGSAELTRMGMDTLSGRIETCVADMRDDVSKVAIAVEQQAAALQAHMGREETGIRRVLIALLVTCLSGMGAMGLYILQPALGG